MRIDPSFSNQSNSTSRTRFDCPSCGVQRRMRMISSEPALYCGRDKVFYECTTCGVENSQIECSR